MMALVCYPSNGVFPACVCEGVTSTENPRLFSITEIHKLEAK